jgi:16S rRNA processing protein RimM
MSDQANNPPAPSASPVPEHLLVGQVVSPFGIKGELKVTILTEFPDRFKKLGAVLLAPYNAIPAADVPPSSLNPGTVRRAPVREGQTFRPPKEPTEFTIESARFHKGHVMVKLEGVEDANDAETLRGYWLMVPTGKAHRLPSGAFYIYQVLGLDVYTPDGEHVGKIEEVLTGTANDVYVVRGPGVTDPTGELLVPAVKQFVHSIDVDGGRVVIAPPAEWT